MSIYSDQIECTGVAAPPLRAERVAQLLGSMWFATLAGLATAELALNVNVSLESKLSSFCLATFYVLLALLMLTRPPAKAQARGLLPKCTAFLGTYMPWIVGAGGKADAMQLHFASAGLTLIGIVMMLISVRHLGESFSVVPQARKVVKTGPYRYIKHPLYLAEEIAFLGLVMQNLTVLSVSAFVAHLAVQICRIRFEEDILRRTCPDYAAYEATRWRLIPHVW